MRKSRRIRRTVSRSVQLKLPGLDLVDGSPFGPKTLDQATELDFAAARRSWTTFHLM